LKQNRTAIILLLTGLLAAAAAAAVVFFLTANVHPPVEVNTTITPQPTAQTRPVIMAAADIPATTRITSTMVLTVPYPVNLIPVDAITSMSEVLTATASVNILSGQILLKRQFQRDIIDKGIPKGKVLVAFPATDMLNSTGAVQEGDRVDILLSIPISGTTRLDAGADVGSQVGAEGKTLVTQGTLQNVRVYSVGFWTPPGQPADQNAQQQQNAGLKVISFVVDRQEALILKYVKDSGGTIDLAVRSAEDTEETATDPVTIDYLVDLYGFIGLQQTQPPAPAPAP
jgi:pilus assembly protein CpaB